VLEEGVREPAGQTASSSGPDHILAPSSQPLQGGAGLLEPLFGFGGERISTQQKDMDICHGDQYMR